MAPVKHKKTKRKNLHHENPPAPKAAPIVDAAPAITPSTLSLSPQVGSSRALAHQSSPRSQTATEVADQLHSAAIHLLRRLRVRDRETNVGPAQLSALSVLVFGGPKSLGELADAEQVRRPTMSRIVAGLQRSGLVRRHATEDGRRVRLEASPKGVSLMWEARKRRVESLANAVGILPENEKQQLREALTLLQQVMRNL
jgi:DNA-binding MarR family transcriptional regulator